MTTKPKIDNQQSTVSGAPSDMETASAAQAEDASRQLLAKARYDAFRLMTESRDEAETILAEARAEARGTREAAEMTSASAIEKADVQAAEIVESARQEAATIVAGAHRRAGEEAPATEPTALEAEHKELSERVSTLRTLADQLEDRFAALAQTAAPDQPKEPPSTLTAESAATAIDYSPSVAPPPRTESATVSAPTEVARESFYNRRSANLPRLGEDGGRSALDMTRTMRQALEKE